MIQTRNTAAATMPSAMVKPEKSFNSIAVPVAGILEAGSRPPAPSRAE